MHLPCVPMRLVPTLLFLYAPVILKRLRFRGRKVELATEG